MNLFAASNAPVLAIVLAAVAVLLLILISASVRMVREYERAVVFRLGRCVGSILMEGICEGEGRRGESGRTDEACGG